MTCTCQPMFMANAVFGLFIVWLPFEVYGGTIVCICTGSWWCCSDVIHWCAKRLGMSQWISQFANAVCLCSVRFCMCVCIKAIVDPISIKLTTCVLPPTNFFLAAVQSSQHVYTWQSMEQLFSMMSFKHRKNIYPVCPILFPTLKALSTTFFLCAVYGVK